MQNILPQVDRLIILKGLALFSCLLFTPEMPIWLSFTSISCFILSLFSLDFIQQLKKLFVFLLPVFIFFEFKTFRGYEPAAAFLISITCLKNT